MTKERIIKTNTNGNVANEILSGVIGQMSDGMFENSTYYEGYWKFVDIDQNNNICINKKHYHISYGGHETYNRFIYMTDTEIKEFFAKLIKRIIQQELRDSDIPVRGMFKKGNMMLTKYLNYKDDVTIDDCVTVYNILLGKENNMYKFENVEIEKYGGNCHMFFGTLENGNWFYVTDSWDYSFITTEDLSSYIYDDDFEQKCIEKCVKELDGDDDWKFRKEVISYIVKNGHSEFERYYE